MASKCPKCGESLKWYNVKAECKHCGANIPNYNWEARLEEDNKIAEEKFQKLYHTMNVLRYTAIGTKLRKYRIALTLLPAIGFILPWAQVKSDIKTLSLDLLGIFTDGENTLKFFGIFFKDIGGIISQVTSAGLAGDFILGFLLMLLSIVAIVAAFLLAFILFKKPKTKIMCIADVISILFAGAAAVFFIKSNAVIGTGTFWLGHLLFKNATSGVMWGIFVYIALLFVALVANILVSKADVKSKETLEEERLERVRIKEEKEEAERIRKEAARAEAKKKAEAEEAEKIRKAREALATKDNKK